MKILFLDFDGVLNCRTSDVDETGFLGLDSSRKALIERICKKTNCKVVISSSWRLTHSLTELKNFFKNYEIDILDETPVNEKVVPFYHRGVEIKKWLDNHNDIQQYVILDDCDEFLPEQHKHFVKCSYKYGLTPVIANDVINIFNGETNE